MRWLEQSFDWDAVAKSFEWIDASIIPGVVVVCAGWVFALVLATIAVILRMSR